MQALAWRRSRSPERHARRRQQEALAQVRERLGGRLQPPLLESQSRGRIPRCAGDEQRIPGAAAGAPQRLTPRHLAEQLHRHAQRSARRVPADQRHLVRTRQRAEARRKLRQPALVGIRQREREQRPGRPRPHRRKVAEVDREGAVADGRRRGLVREVHAGDQRIGGRDQLGLGRDREQRGVVTDARDHIGTLRPAGAEVPLDQREFRQRHVRMPAFSAPPAATHARRDPARRSRTCVRRLRQSAAQVPPPR